MKKTLLIILGVYRRVISPLIAGLGGGCRFHPTCSAYADEAIRQQPLGRALGLVAWRLARCGPWHPGGFERFPLESVR